MWTLTSLWRWSRRSQVWIETAADTIVEVLAEPSWLSLSVEQGDQVPLGTDVTIIAEADTWDGAGARRGVLGVIP